MRTVQERVIKQIQTCLSIHPSNQYRLKVFPCMGSQVFVRTLQKMGITVFQTDFEADEEIAQLSKKLGFTVLSNDSDFYVFDVPFILLESICHKRVCTEKKTKSREAFKYMACYHFSVESFCEVSTLLWTLTIIANFGTDFVNFAYTHYTPWYSIHSILHIKFTTQKTLQYSFPSLLTCSFTVFPL